MNRTETAGPHPGRFNVLARKQRPRLPLRREPLQRGLDEGWERREVVAALEDGGDPRSQLRAPRGQVAKAVGGDEHVGQRVVVVRVEPADTSTRSGSKDRQQARRPSERLGVHGVAQPAGRGR